jgi:hypothetical protein
MAGFIEQRQWKTFLDDFTKRNQFRATRLEVIGDVGAQEEAKSLPLVGVSYEPKGSDAGDVVIILGGETAEDQRHLEHLVPQVERIAPLIGETGEEGVGFEGSDGGKTLLVFEKLPEIPEETAAAT